MRSNPDELEIEEVFARERDGSGKFDTRLDNCPKALISERTPEQIKQLERLYNKAKKNPSRYKTNLENLRRILEKPFAKEPIRESPGKSFVVEDSFKPNKGNND